MGTGKYAAPKDAEEFYRRDAAYILGLVRKHLYQNGNVQDAEDAAADIMEKLLTSRNAEGKNALEQYDPDTLSEHTGHNVAWRAFLSAKVMLYIRGKRERISRINGREPLICDTVAGENGTRWVELFGGQAWDDYAVLKDEEFADRMANYLATVPDPGPVSLFAVFNQILESVKDGEPGLPLHRLGLGRKDARETLGRLREAVRAAAAAPDPGTFDVMGVELSAAEVRDAIDRLKAGRGNHVHTPLRGHRLQAEAARGWYHPFSQLERQLYPECDTDSRTHRQPADHVKRAVIHRLERMLAEAGLACSGEPEDVTPDEVLEAELWHIKGLDAEQIDAVLDAVRKVRA